MARVVPLDPPAPHRVEMTELSVEVCTVTPIVGGGPRALENDPITPVRGSSIRGQLRFWWRATRGRCATDPQQLGDLEAAVWGSAETASPVRIRVRILSGGTSLPSGTVRETAKGTPTWKVADGLPGYALFPLDPTSREGSGPSEPPRLLEAVRFQLVLTFPDRLEPDVRAALWAFINFGGLGARTRRGCGSLYAKEFSPDPGEEIGTWFTRSLGVHAPAAPAGSPGFSTLGERIAWVDRREKPSDAWKQAVELLQRFRRFGPAGPPSRRGGASRESRRPWPEADAVRRLAEDRPDGSECFPRSELGLPIVFHFKDGATADHVVQWNHDVNRMASPVILKALAVSSKEAHPVLIALRSPLPATVAVLEKPKRKARTGAPKLHENLPVRCPAGGGHSPLGTASALDGLFEFARGEGWRA